MSFFTVFNVAPIAGRMRRGGYIKTPGWHGMASPLRGSLPHSNNLELSSCPVLLAACIYTKKGGSRSGASWIMRIASYQSLMNLRV